MKTLIIRDDAAAAARIILQGGLVAVPTETVYGLAANGLDETAVEKIYAVKGRPERKPISLFVSDMDNARLFCRDIPPAAEKLAERFWPGPLTMVLKRRENVPAIVTAGGDCVGLRCPDNAFVLAMLRLAGVPVTGTSANLSGQPDAVTFAEAMAYLDGKVDGAVDGGRCPGGVPSTVVDMTLPVPRILRLGAIGAVEIEAVTGERVSL